MRPASPANTSSVKSDQAPSMYRSTWTSDAATMSGHLYPAAAVDLEDQDAAAKRVQQQLHERPVSAAAAAGLHPQHGRTGAGAADRGDLRASRQRDDLGFAAVADNCGAAAG